MQKSLSGSLDALEGTVEYDGGTQNVIAVYSRVYYNLEIDQSGTKTAHYADISLFPEQLSWNLHHQTYVQSAATYAIAATSTSDGGSG